MPCSREQLEQRERQTLPPYAQFSSQSRGRVHPEPPAPWRTEFQRDRDRVIHARAFRRLEYKTQVFLNGTGDHLRTRPTPSKSPPSPATSPAPSTSTTTWPKPSPWPTTSAIPPSATKARKSSTNSCATTAASSTTARASASSRNSRKNT